jgi:DNA-binding MarR family transcriptional regulator
MNDARKHGRLAANGVRERGPPADDALRRRGNPPFQDRRVAEQLLIDEITRAARRIPEARDLNGEPVFRTDGVWRVLATVARSTYCLAIADLARALGVRKQRAHELAHAAVRAGVIELAPNPHDKRILQALLTPIGRAAVRAAASAETIWLATLLNGLGDREMATATHVVSVIRQRLERDARELAQMKASRPK